MMVMMMMVLMMMMIMMMVVPMMVIFENHGSLSHNAVQHAKKLPLQVNSN